MSQKKSVTVLGSTGSIGTSTLDVLARHPERFEVHALTASSQVDLILEQCARFRPRHAVMAREDAGRQLADRVRAEGLPVQVSWGLEALDAVASAPEVDVVMAAIVGAAGLSSCLAAAHAGKRLLLANKEALVVGGEVFLTAVRAGQARLLPIDSEHSAIFQSLPEDPLTWPERVDRIILTASGGPFRSLSPEALRDVTPEQAVAHPNWVMGRKISVDSATMMNKALEIIEARWLFGLTREQLAVCVHPQSLVHSLVEYEDGSVIAQMSPPDMRLPIQYALTYPERVAGPTQRTDWSIPQTLQLLPPDFEAFPALRLGFEVAEQGGTCGAVLNAANEVAVERFLQGKLDFLCITKLVQDILGSHNYDSVPTLQRLTAVDNWAREEARRWKS